MSLTSLNNFRTADGKVLLVGPCWHDGTDIHLQPPDFLWPLTPGTPVTAAHYDANRSSWHDQSPVLPWERLGHGLLGYPWGIGGGPGLTRILMHHWRPGTAYVVGARIVRATIGPYYPSAWHPSTFYTAGDFVTNKGKRYIAMQTGTSAGPGAEGPTGPGTNIADGTVVWDYYVSATTSIPARRYVASQAGTSTSGIFEMGPVDTGTDIVDGSVRWDYIEDVSSAPPMKWIVFAVDEFVTVLNHVLAKVESGEVRLAGTAAEAKAYLIAEGAPPTNAYTSQPEMVFGPTLPDPLPDPAGYADTSWGRAALGISNPPPYEWLTWMDDY